MTIKTILLISILSGLILFTAYIYFSPSQGGKGGDFDSSDDNNNIYIKDFVFKEEEEEKNFIPREEENKKQLGEGNMLACDSLKHITGNDVQKNYDFKIKDGTLKVDCYDKTSNIALDYKNEDNYNYIYNRDFTLIDFYDGVYKDKVKEDILSKNKINYYKIPYLVDRCFKTSEDEYICEKDITKGIRVNRITHYLENILVAS